MVHCSYLIGYFTILFYHFYGKYSEISNNSCLTNSISTFTVGFVTILDDETNRFVESNSNCTLDAVLLCFISFTLYHDDNGNLLYNKDPDQIAPLYPLERKFVCFIALVMYCLLIVSLAFS